MPCPCPSRTKKQIAQYLHISKATLRKCVWYPQHMYTVNYTYHVIHTQCMTHIMLYTDPFWFSENVCFDIHSMYKHTHPLTLFTQVGDTICSNNCFPAFPLSLSLYLYSLLSLSFSFTLVGHNLFKQLFSRFPFLRNVQRVTKTGPFVTQTAIDPNRHPQSYSFTKTLFR